MQRHHEDRRRAAFDQPLGARDAQIRDRAQALFALYYERLREEHEEMRQARRMRQLRQENRSGTSPALTTLLSSIDNVVADQIDNLPEARMIPEREETMQSAQEMTDVVSYVLYHAGWPGKYQRIMEDAVVTGTGVAQVFWDDDLEDGEGMVSVLCW
ncbi:MAG: hypothetical protein Q4A66_13845, partial [Eubacteriales bacterium]|nr:hypothetical protein [Eubacteriales bacterium]